MLEEIRAETQRRSGVVGLGAKSIGHPDLDQELWNRGRELLRKKTAANENGPDLYLATQLYAGGGHTALIGDFVRALGGEKTSRLILTNLDNSNSAPLSEDIRERIAIAPENIVVLEGATMEERLQALVRQICSLKWRFLFLFHHPDDPLPSVVAQPAIGRQRFIVHHSDFAPSLGLHLPGMQLIDLSRQAASMSRILGLTSSWLPLSAPDPGRRPTGFLRRGKIVTASCGAMHKFTRDYFYRYPETVAHILRRTNGWHLHIGPLEEQTLAELPRDRFIHLEWTPSLAKTLWENEVDLFLASFPVDGARTSVEVFASATPYLAHAPQPRRDSEAHIFWSTFEDLDRILRTAAHRRFLVKHARNSRRVFEKFHRPRVFAATLRNILSGKGGRRDPDASARDLRTMQGLLRAVTAAAFQQRG